MKTGFVGDVHANARALRAALQVLDEQSADELIFLGDLLSYGGDVTEVIDLVGERVAKGASVVLGNHDRLYLDLLAGEMSYYRLLPDWIRESVDFTLARLDAAAFRAIPFRREHRSADRLVAHANPFGPGPDGAPNWRYLRSPRDHEEAADALYVRGLTVGVFGHTHRARIVKWPSGEGVSSEETDLSLRGWAPSGGRDALVINVGSVGQPRNTAAHSAVAWMERKGITIDVTIRPLSYDVQGHISSLASLPLTTRAISALQAFFVPIISG